MLSQIQLLYCWVCSSQEHVDLGGFPSYTRILENLSVLQVSFIVLRLSTEPPNLTLKHQL